jgi:hypothetical protein
LLGQRGGDLLLDLGHGRRRWFPRHSTRPCCQKSVVFVVAVLDDDIGDTSQSFAGLMQNFSGAIIHG